MLKIVKKAEATLKQKIVINVLGILCALLTAALFLALGGFNPLDIYISMVNGAFGSNYRISQTVINAVPLIILSLGIAIAFRMKFWNIGAEGQILMGGFLFGRSLGGLPFGRREREEAPINQLFILL